MSAARLPDLAGFPLVRRTAHEVVVVKPADVPSEMTADPGGRSVISRLRAAFAPPHPGRAGDASSAPSGIDLQLPHRLDRPTRGLLVVALSREAVARHNEHIRAGRWRKFYLARVAAGAPLTGEHRAYLRRDGRTSAVVRSGGDPARLEVLCEAAAPSAPGERHLLIRLDTGRYHQIRVMLASLGFPLIGDGSYGGRPGSMYLEHAVLRMIDLDSELPARLFWPDDPQREALDPLIAATLTRCGTEP